MMSINQSYVYEIRVEGLLRAHWSDWFEGLIIHNHSDGASTLCGPLADQAALFGVLTKIHALNLTLISVQRLSALNNFAGSQQYNKENQNDT